MSLVNYSVEEMDDGEIKQRIAVLQKQYNACMDGHTRELLSAEASYLRSVLKTRSFKTPKKVVRIKDAPTVAQKAECARIEKNTTWRL